MPSSKGLCIALLMFISAQSRAENPIDTCANDPTRCSTVAVPAAISVASSIYAVQKYSAAKIFEQSNTKVLYDNSTQPAVVNNSGMSGPLAQIQEGDRITVVYQLSEAENRAYHIDLMEQRAREARSSASASEVLAATATRSVYETRVTTNSDGSTSTENVYVGEEPDLAARAMHAQAAVQKRLEAADYDAKALSARHGGPVPTYNFDKVFEKSEGTRTAVADFLRERAAKLSKIVTIKNLPAAQFATLKRMIWKGRGAVGAAVVAGALAGEELLEGYVADQLHQEQGSHGIRAVTRDEMEHYRSGSR